MNLRDSWGSRTTIRDSRSPVSNAPLPSFWILLRGGGWQIRTWRPFPLVISPFLGFPSPQKVSSSLARPSNVMNPPLSLCQETFRILYFSRPICARFYTVQKRKTACERRRSGEDFPMGNFLPLAYGTLHLLNIEREKREKER